MGGMARRSRRVVVPHGRRAEVPGPTDRGERPDAGRRAGLRAERGDPPPGRSRSVRSVAVGDTGRRRAWSLAACVVAASAVAGCSDDGGEVDGSASTTAAAQTFEERDAVARLSSAATGMSLVASDISLRALQGGGVDYCRSEAPAELTPHRATLEGAEDEEVRRRAGAALADLEVVVEACAGGEEQERLQDAIARYNASFTRLRERLDQLLGTG